MLNNNQISNLQSYRQTLPAAKSGNVERSKILSLRSKCPFVYDQEGLNSCTSCALSMALIIGNFKVRQPSRLFLFYKESNRASFQEPSEADAIYVITNIGVCSENSWPYIPSMATTPPPSRCDLEAVNNRITQATIIPITQTIIDDACNILALNIPIMMGFHMYSNFLQAINGQVEMPSGAYVGGHEVLIIGYDDYQGRFLCINSWGSNWGDNGFFTIPYEYIARPDLIYSLVIINKI